MNKIAYRYRFWPQMDLADPLDTLVLAVFAAEGLFGHARVVMDLDYGIDRTINVIVVDASTLIGQVINAIFTAFISREFGLNAFGIRRVESVVASDQGGRR